MMDTTRLYRQGMPTHLRWFSHALLQTEYILAPNLEECAACLYAAKHAPRSRRGSYLQNLLYEISEFVDSQARFPA